MISKEKLFKQRKGGGEGGKEKGKMIIARLVFDSLSSFTVKLTDAADDPNIWRVVPLRSHRCRLPRPYLNLQQRTRWPFQVHNTTSKPTSMEDPLLLSSRVVSFEPLYFQPPIDRLPVSFCPGTAP